MPLPPFALLRYLPPALVALLVAGCGTVSLPSRQQVQILAFDAADRPVTGMECKVSNLVDELTVKTPAIDVPVRRSYSDLQIECRRGKDIAMGTVVPRRDGLEQALIPFGSVAVAIDHLTGHLYSYPTVVRLRLGQHLRYEFSNEARAAGLIATVGDTMVVDLSATPAPREALPAAVPAAAVKPVRAEKASAKPTSPARAPAGTTSHTSPVQPATPHRTAPLTW